MAEQTKLERYIRNLIVDETYRYIRFGGNYKDIAHSTDLSVSTVKKFTADPPTRFPRLNTAMALLEFYGYSLQGTKVEVDAAANALRHGDAVDRLRPN